LSQNASGSGTLIAASRPQARRKLRVKGRTSARHRAAPSDTESWNQGHVPGAIHLPTSQIAKQAAELIARDKTVVVYCWGPGCNGAQKTAVEFARLGYTVKEMLGGFEYWAREGWAVETGTGAITRRSVDPLTAPASGISCAC
jgi:rhodanese-related sulfurtransferase